MTKVTPDASDDVVGVIGLGNMGDGIARCLLRAGLHTLVYDIRPECVRSLGEAGAGEASSVTDLAGRSSIVLVVVFDESQVGDVVDEIFDSARAGTHIVIQSTVRPAMVAELCSRAASLGFVLIDATVTGGGEKSQRGLLTVMVGGDDAAVDRCWPVFEAIGQTIHRVGPIGSASAVKLVNNMLSLGSHALLLEAMELGAAYGLDEDTITRVVTSGQGDSRGIRTWGRVDRMRRDHTWPSPHEPLTKDLREAMLAGALHGLVMPMAAVAATTLPTKIAARDAVLDRRAPYPPIPRCVICDQELAAPYRDAGEHPECRNG